MDGVQDHGQEHGVGKIMGKIMDDGERLPVAGSIPQDHTAPEGLPPGFRFHPTDEELVWYYLKPKIRGLRIHADIIPEFTDLYKHEPWDLQGKSFRPSWDKAEFYLFGPRQRKYPNGLKTNRATPEGYWKSTGTDRRLLDGWKKTLVYHLGRAPKGVRCEWVMHEYRLHDDSMAAVQVFSLALCRVINKKATCVGGRLPSSGIPSAAPPEVPIADDDDDDLSRMEQLLSDDDFCSWMEEFLSDVAGCSTATTADLCSAEEEITSPVWHLVDS